MYKKLLVLDAPYLCHRAKYAMGGLSHENKPTSVVYGFLKTISHLQKLFNTSYIAFCWDSKTSKREEIFPAYKANRKDKYKDMDKDAIKLEKEFRWQMKKLRREYLSTIGYKNVFVQKGYEADDIIASICINLPMMDEAIIISSDHDLYQLIRPNVSFYIPQKNKILTLQGFKKQYGIIPEQWPIVKCLAGCSTDGVPGIEGIGEKTAIKYLIGELKVTTKAFQKIKEEQVNYMRKNHPLIALPFTGTKNPRLQKDKVTQAGWNKVIKTLGMESLKDKAPIFERRKNK